MTVEATCKGCGARIFWGTLQCPDCDGRSEGCRRCRGRGEVRVPLDANAPTFVPVEHESEGTTMFVQRSDALVSHFATCPKAREFSGRRRGQRGEGGRG